MNIRILAALACVLTALLLLGACGTTTPAVDSPVTLGTVPVGEPGEVVTSAAPRAISDWVDTYGWIVDDLEGALTEINDGAGDYDVDAMQSGCSALARVIGRAGNVPAIPDPEVDTYWQLALSRFGDAASACLTLDLETMASSISSASDALGYATDAIGG